MTVPIHVLVIFCSPSESTEKLALAAAVGAVQARGNIRIRRLPENAEQPADGNDPLARMQREYVPPTPADTLWADAVIIAMNNRISGLPSEPDSATIHGSQVTAAIRAFKQNSE